MLQDSPSDKPSAKPKRVVWLSLALFLITIAVYAPAVRFDFIDYDDPDYVSANPVVQKGLTLQGVRWAFTSAAAFNWHPVTWLSHMLDCELFHLQPAGHHGTSILLHAFNAVLLFWILRRTTGAVWRSACVSALFAWHPLRLESVVWVCERKDVLSTFFMFLTIWAYTTYVASERKRAALFYVMGISFFALGLMSKPMLVTLPFVLLLLDYWPLNRIVLHNVPRQPAAAHNRARPFTKAPASTKQQNKSNWVVIIEKIPFFALTIASAIVTFLVQKSQGAVSSLDFIALHERISNALVSVLRYIGKLFWPTNLAIYYPFPDSWPVWLIGASGLLTLGLSVCAFWGLRKRPYIAVGWFWFLGTLIPVIGLIQVGTQSMADRYTYIPTIGILILTVWTVSELVSGTAPKTSESPRPNPKKTLPTPKPSRAFAPVALAGSVIGMSLLSTIIQLPHWKDSKTVFEHALHNTSNNIVARVMLANALGKAGQHDAAIKHYSEVLRMQPAFAEVRYNLANALTEAGHCEEAAAQYREVLRARPDYAEAWYNLSISLERLGRKEESRAAFTEFSRLRPEQPTPPAQGTN